MTCNSCGNEQASGRFCSECGAPLEAMRCPDCGTASAAGSRFCTECGRRLAGGGGAASTPRTPDAVQAPSRQTRPSAGTGSSSRLAWGVAGILLVAVVMIVGVPALGTDPPPPGANAAAADGPSTVDLSTMTPREAADRLFNRVVGAAEAGDSMQARNFVPMAIAAYERVPTLDNDGYYHLSVLQRIGGQFDRAIETAELVLAEEPAHILALSAAGAAAVEAGDSESAAEYFERLISGFDSERDRQLSEYLDHGRILETLRDEAESYLQSTR